ncbi:MAG: hypothetical protein ABI472_23680, partial [Ginsengibacter sp.]
MLNHFMQIQMLQVLPFGNGTVWTLLLIPLLPLAAFVVLGLFGRKHFRNASGIIATMLLLVSTALSFYTAYHYFFDYGKVGGVYQTLTAVQVPWLQFSPGLSIDMG